MKNTEIPLTQYQLDIKAEKILISQTLNLTPLELEAFLTKHDVPKDEYEYLVSKYSRIIEEYKKDNKNV